MTVDLTLLGAFSVRCGDAAVAFPTRKAQALFSYLALLPDRIHEREKLCGLLWGDTGRDQAYSSLRQTLFGIRKALPPAVKGALVANGRTVALDSNHVRSDAALLERRAAETSRAGLEEAAALYKGPLLEGFAIDEAAFEEWLTLERGRFSELAGSTLFRLALLQAQDGAFDRAIQTRLQLLRLDPWGEDNHRSLMQLYAQQGRRSAALAQYQQCVAALERELGVEPEPATKQLYEEIARFEGVQVTPREPLPRTRDAALGVASSDAGLVSSLARPGAPFDSSLARPGTPFDSSLAHPRARLDSSLAREGALFDSSLGRPRAPFDRAPLPRAGVSPIVGRSEQLSRLSCALEDAWMGQGRVALLVGEAGVGKTRLLEELSANVAARGGLVIRGRCFESEQVLPFAPWVDALRGESALSDETLWSGLTPASRTELSRLLPRGEKTTSDEIPSQENALRLLEAVLGLLSKLAEQTPLLVVLDDVQWADDMSLRLLSFLGRRLSGGPRICLAASLRQEALSPGSLLSTALGELSREGCLFNIAVAPLSSHDTAALAQNLISQETASLDARVQEQIWSLSEGNPFVVVEAVRALSEGALSADVADLPVPDRVREVITGHVTRLSPFEQQIVAVAAAIGREFEFALLRMAADGEEEATAAAVEQLVRVGIFRASGDKLYFAHERIREVVYEGLLGPRRMVLHGRVARALCVVHAGSLHEIYGRLAFHYGKADEPRAAVTYLTHFADGAARTFGLKEALTALSEANLFTQRLPQAERAQWCVEVAVRQAKCLFHLGRFVEIGPCLEPHLPGLDALKRPDLNAQVHFWLGCASGLLGNTAAAVSSGERALAAAQRGGVKAARRVHTLLAWEAAFAGRFQKGIEHGLSATVSLTDADAEPEYISSGWMTAGVNYFYAGRHVDALLALEQARSVAQAAGVLRVEALSLAFTALTHAELDDPEAALTAGKQAVAMAPDPVSTTGTLGLLAHVHVAAGRADEALEILRTLIHEQSTKVRPSQSGSLLALSRAYLLKGDLEKAHTFGERALSTARVAAHPVIAGVALRVLGEIAEARDELPAAYEHIEESRRLLESIGSSFQLGRSLCALASVAQRMGDLCSAVARLEQAERLYRNLGLIAPTARVGQLLAALRGPEHAPAVDP